MGNYITPADKDENKSLASIKKILDYINLNYSQPLTAAELTALSNYSEYYFMKLFKQYTGKTLIAYINDLRIEKAKPMLLHSDSSVTEIALEVGFNNTAISSKSSSRQPECLLTNFAETCHKIAILLYFF